MISYLIQDDQRVFGPYDLEEKVYVQTANANFLADIAKKFPDKNTKLIVSCSDGRLWRILLATS